MTDRLEEDLFAVIRQRDAEQHRRIQLEDELEQARQRINAGLALATRWERNWVMPNTKWHARKLYNTLSSVPKGDL
jgi:IS5 family transposase